MNATDITAIEKELRGACGFAAALVARELHADAAGPMANARTIAARLPDTTPADAIVAAYHAVAERSDRMADEFRGARAGTVAAERYDATARAARTLAADVA